MKAIILALLILLPGVRPIGIAISPLAAGPAVVTGRPSGDGAQAATGFAVKAFHLDMRIQVMTMPALKAFVQQLHRGGINTLIMEYEATYPYEKHPLIANHRAYTKSEIKDFIAYCGKLNIDVIPLQQSFGHVEYILRHYRYKTLREDNKDLSQVCPQQTVEDSLLFTDLYTELAATHPSPYIHIGCDETYLLGHCALCRAKVEAVGLSRLYTDYVRMLCNIVIRLGKRPVLWADITFKYPEAIASLPAGTIFVDWNYGWSMDKFGDHQRLLQSGFEIWGAPAIRSHPDNYYLTQWEKHFNNIRDFVSDARQMGYKGMVLTSWSTSGAYSYTYESETGLAGLGAIRHVYPITGFSILLAAYMEALRSDAPLDIPAFMVSYCGRQFGFNPAQALVFWQALITAPYEVADGVVQRPVPMSLAVLTDSCVSASRVLHQLQPSANKREFGHFRLMADIRVQHLRFLEIEQEANSPAFTKAGLPDLLRKLRTLLGEDSLLSQKLIGLNKEDFYLSELGEENELRSVRIRELYQRLAGIR